MVEVCRLPCLGAQHICRHCHQNKGLMESQNRGSPWFDEDLCVFDSKAVFFRKFRVSYCEAEVSNIARKLLFFKPFSVEVYSSNRFWKGLDVDDLSWESTLSPRWNFVIFLWCLKGAPSSHQKGNFAEDLDHHLHQHRWGPPTCDGCLTGNRPKLCQLHCY